MPANLTQQYHKAEAIYKAATTPEEQMDGLRGMMREIPKHKGTEKMRADLKRRISQLTKEQKASKGMKRFAYRIEKQGGGCVTLVGTPNVGKSALLNALTNAEVEVADYPFSTREPHQAMMMFEDMPIELVDLPPVSDQHTETWLLPLIRISDLVLIMLDLSSDDVLDMAEETFRIVEGGKIKLVTDIPSEDEQDIHFAYIPAMVVLNKSDHPSAADNKEIFMEFYDRELPICDISIHDAASLDILRGKIVKTLDVLRVYSKTPSHQADMEKPYILKRGSHLLDFASQVHKDFTENLAFARVWGINTFDGQRVDRDYILADKDVVELHM